MVTSVWNRLTPRSKAVSCSLPATHRQSCEKVQVPCAKRVHRSAVEWRALARALGEGAMQGLAYGMVSGAPAPHVSFQGVGRPLIHQDPVLPTFLAWRLLRTFSPPALTGPWLPCT